MKKLFLITLLLTLLATSASFGDPRAALVGFMGIPFGASIESAENEMSSKLSFRKSGTTNFGVLSTILEYEGTFNSYVSEVTLTFDFNQLRFATVRIRTNEGNLLKVFGNLYQQLRSKYGEPNIPTDLNALPNIPNLMANLKNYKARIQSDWDFGDRASLMLSIENDLSVKILYASLVDYHARIDGTDL